MSQYVGIFWDYFFGRFKHIRIENVYDVSQKYLEGGYAVVYRAKLMTKQDVGKPVALKVFRRGIRDESELGKDGAVKVTPVLTFIYLRNTEETFSRL